MNDKDSPIFSTDVSLGTPLGSKNEASEPSQPWVFLICSDLGFISHTPQKISAATLNELIATNNVLISGTVQFGLPSDIASFYVEYPVGDVKDLSSAAIAEKLPFLQNLKKTSTVLDAIAGNKMTVSEGLHLMEAMDLPQSIVRQLATITIPDVNATPPPPPPAGRPSKVDSILSMMAVDIPASPPASQQSIDFISALSEGATRQSSTAAVLSCKESVDKLIMTLASVIAAQPFYKAVTSSWNALKKLLKTAGRNRNLHFYLHSAPFDAAQRHFADALGYCAASSGIPDLVIWDYPVTIDNASMQQLEHIGTIADRYKTTVLLSLYYRDELYRRIIDNEPMRTVIEHPAFIPLRRLQANAVSRCLALCTPDALDQHRKDDPDLSITGSWLLALQWTCSFIENGAPFDVYDSPVMMFDGYSFPLIARETVMDAHLYGINILTTDGINTPRVLLGDANSPYSSLLFNMMVNRTARLAASWISEHDASLSCEKAAPLLACYLYEQLASYKIIEAQEAITVNPQGSESLGVTINSTETIATFPVQFEFSFNYKR